MPGHAIKLFQQSASRGAAYFTGTVQIVIKIKMLR